MLALYTWNHNKSSYLGYSHVPNTKASNMGKLILFLKQVFQARTGTILIFCQSGSEETGNLENLLKATWPGVTKLE